MLQRPSQGSIMESARHQDRPYLPAPDWLREFNADGHYYTAFPSLNHWRDGFTHRQYNSHLGEFCASGSPAHLYVHIPFCAKLCWYCVCNFIITNDRARIQQFVNYLTAEAAMLYAYRPNIREIQLGGGTPSHLDHAQFE